MLLAAFVGGIGFGRTQSINKDTYLEYPKHDNLYTELNNRYSIMRDMWIEEQEKAESWERRYWALANTEKENQIGS